MGRSFHLFHSGMQIQIEIVKYLRAFKRRLHLIFRQITRNCKQESCPLTLAYHLVPLVMYTWYPTMTCTAREIAYSPRPELCWKENLTAQFSVFVQPITTKVNPSYAARGK